ncbi:MAG TPA: HAMP domain-containing sensor histidine kinase [Vicinamibacterales bacterium]|jgi:signal transduction histidine kinase
MPGPHWFGRASLGAQVSLLVALIVTIVVTAVAYSEVRLYDRDIERTLAQTARLAAESAASVAEREPRDALDLRDSLHDLIDADPSIDAISVIDVDEAGLPRVFTSTSTEERAEILDLAGRAVAMGTPLSTQNETVVMFAQPVPRRPMLAVAVTVGLESLLQARARSVGIALGFALPSIALVTLLVHLSIRRLLRWNRKLQERVGDAARDLSVRSAQLASSQLQLLAIRESLARTERVAALGQVAATVAHQAGTPLNLVSGYVQMILEDPQTDERTRNRLRTVDAQIAQVTRVLRTMLDRARHTPQSEIVRLPAVIEHVREVSAPRLSRANIHLLIQVAPQVPPVRADASQLEMALLNLVTNALDAMPDGGTLSIAVSHDVGGVRIEVADTGPGIPTQVAEHLFDPWVTTKPAGQGTGLGLAIVRDVVRAHAGSVSVRTEPRGTVFVIILPAVTLHPTAA